MNDDDLIQCHFTREEICYLRDSIYRNIQTHKALREFTAPWGDFITVNDTRWDRIPGNILGKLRSYLRKEV